jgi:ParB-like chromosome segregation protein Spo0J
MNVLERCQVLRAEVDKYEMLKRAENEASGFRERTNDIAKTHAALGNALGKRDVLVTRSLPVPTLPHAAKAMALIAEFRASMDSPQEATKAYGQLKRTLNKLATDTAQGVTDAIAAVSAEMPSVEEPFLKAVGRIPGYEERVNRIRLERAAVTLNAAPHELGAEYLARFLDARGRLQTLAADLRPAEFPREVLVFFDDLRRQRGLPLGRLTDTVREWLDVHGLLDQIRITLG